MIELDIVERLRGKVRVPVNDGAGLLDGKDFFERSFPTSKAAMEAADEIQRLRCALTEMVEAFEPFTSRPMGAPNSDARVKQQLQIAAHRDAKAALPTG